MSGKRLQINITSEVAEKINEIKRCSDSYDTYLRKTLGLPPIPRGRKRK